MDKTYSELHKENIELKKKIKALQKELGNISSSFVVLKKELDDRIELDYITENGKYEILQSRLNTNSPWQYNIEDEKLNKR
jgi:archaellum component FlaC